MKICLFGSGSKNLDSKYITQGYNLGLEIANNTHTLVFGGGSNGMMGAVSRGVYEAKGFIEAVIPKWMLEFEELYENCSEVYYTDSMDDRKNKFIELSDAFIIVPGGVGTLDELFEVITLKKLLVHNKPIVILNMYNFYDELLAMLNKMVKENVIPDDNYEIFTVVNTIDEVFEYLENYDFNEYKSYAI